jgi:hypothetical protein
MDAYRQSDVSLLRGDDNHEASHRVTLEDARADVEGRFGYGAHERSRTIQ